MRKIFEPNLIEKKWYLFWSKSNYVFKDAKIKFTMLLPPPNITGNLHMGHAYQNTIIDILLRYNNLNGKYTFLQGGTDHAGIAAQLVVERSFLKKKISRSDIDVNAEKNIRFWVLFSQKNIYRQIGSLGTCVNWKNIRYTLDVSYTELVYFVFVQLYRDGLIYRDYRIVNWDPVLRTAISDLEVIYSEENGFKWFIKYNFVSDVSLYLTIVTTRPETIFGDVAVAVHPEDFRYKSFIGKFVYVPLINKEIPVVGDYDVDYSYGTGCLKVTPAHDFTDYNIGKRHHLPIINIFNEDATLNNMVPSKYRNKDRFVVREEVISDLCDGNFIIKSEDCLISLPRGDRTNAIIEPYLTQQWFMCMDIVVDDAVKVVKEGLIRFIPQHWSSVYINWLGKIKDWCISRQLWWGHRIPGWYDKYGILYVGLTEIEVRTFYNIESTIVLKQDLDVLDTWFSSALWPLSFFSVFSTKNFIDFIPTDILVTGFDIIFFWVVRMVIFNLKFTKKVPFKVVYIHGLICDAEGKKMSKFKGNILDPLDLMYGITLSNLISKRTVGISDISTKLKIEAQTRGSFKEGIKPYGIDALRMTFCFLATNSYFVSFDMAKIFGCKSFLNKVWNAARYLLLCTRTFKETIFNSMVKLDLMDSWIVFEWEQVKSKIETFYKNFNFSSIINLLYDFLKIDYCFWYLEFTKTTIFDFCSNNPLRKKKQFILLNIFVEYLIILHPIVPFITEEIWQKFHVGVKINNCYSILGSFYPKVDYAYINSYDTDSTKLFWLKGILTSIRSYRGKYCICNKRILKICLEFITEEQDNFIDYYDILYNLGKVIYIRNNRIIEKTNIDIREIIYNEVKIYIYIK